MPLFKDTNHGYPFLIAGSFQYFYICFLTTNTLINHQKFQTNKQVHKQQFSPLRFKISCVEYDRQKM